MKVGIVGTGYVGLVSGACFAEMGNDVVCHDVDASKIACLQQGKAHFYEPELDALIAKNIAEERLRVTTDISVLAQQRIIFFCVGTPSDTSGNADLSALFAALDAVLASADGERILVMKSTVPVGTADRVRARIKERSNYSMKVVSNPEFLKQGAAVADSMKPDRVVIGTSDEDAGDELEALYKPFVRTGKPILRMDHRSAEMMKYAANALLATRITFMNQLANLCDQVGADIEHVRLAIGADARIGPAFLFAGVGWGGSCFGKDLKALSYLAQSAGTPVTLCEAALASNETQPLVVLNKLTHALGELSGKTIALWGLSFKPGTDDVRDAPALAIARVLTAQGASIRAYDPKAAENFLRALGENESVSVCKTAYDAVVGADALLLVTEWGVFRNPDFAKLKSLLRQPVIVDGRNQYDPVELRKQGFRYYGVGRA